MSLRSFGLVVALVSVVGASGCTMLGVFDPTPLASEGEGEGGANGPRCDVQALFDTSCVACHAGAGSLAFPDLRPASLASTASLASVLRPDQQLVVPGHPETSFLFTKITSPGAGDGTLMPQGSQLTAAQIDTVRQWILAGAPTTCGGTGEGEGEGAGEGEGEGSVVLDSACGVLQARCAACHNGTLFPPEISAATVTSGALVNAVSAAYPSETYITPGTSSSSFLFTKMAGTQLAGEGGAMPPAAALSAVEQQLVQDWIDAGAPTDNCNGVTLPPPNDPILEDATIPSRYAASATCASGAVWTSGEHGSGRMLPGADCRGCHIQRGRGPVDDVMGTVFLALHEADNCRGAAPTNYSVFVDIMDTQHNVRFTKQTNSVGNFHESGNMPNPYTARVRLVDGAGVTVATQVMVTPQTEGSCNTCHTADANGPASANVPLGRIVISP